MRYTLLGHARRRAAAHTAAVFAAAVLGACKLDQVVQATDPDIINPSDIASPSGAEALRLGTLARFNANTSGLSDPENAAIIGGLLADEFTTGDTFIERQQIDQRSISPDNTYVSGPYRGLHRPRVGAQQARDAIRQYDPNAATTPWRLAEMYFVEAYMTNMLGETFCNGVALSTIQGGKDVYAAPVPNAQVYATAAALVDSGLALVGTTAGADFVRVRNALNVMRARVALNRVGATPDAALLQQVVDAAAAVPTSYVWLQEQSQTSRTPVLWSLVNNQRRYIVANAEGTNGVNFVSAADPRVPTCTAGQAACTSRGFTNNRPFDSSNPGVPNMVYQLVVPTDASSVPVMSGLQARLYEAEARFRLGQYATAGTGSLAILNALRAAPPSYVVSGGTVAPLAALTAAATPEAQRAQIFREKALWLYGTGHRLGDLRRLVRQYGLPQAQVFPTGAWQARGLQYGTDVNLPIPNTESNNPLQPSSNGVAQCIDRNA
jgi:hypothetical protein